MADEITRRAWAYLSRVAEPPCAPLAALVADCGAVAAADRVRRGAVSADLWARVEARHDTDCAARDLEVIDRRGGRLVTPGDEEWPAWVFNDFGRKERPVAEDHPPLVLWVLGQQYLSDVASRAAAIVGTRACTPYGEHVTADLVSGLVERDVAVVSGGGLVL